MMIGAPVGAGADHAEGVVNAVMRCCHTEDAPLDCSNLGFIRRLSLPPTPQQLETIGCIEQLVGAVLAEKAHRQRCRGQERELQHGTEVIDGILHCLVTWFLRVAISGTSAGEPILINGKQVAGEQAHTGERDADREEGVLHWMLRITDFVQLVQEAATNPSFELDATDAEVVKLIHEHMLVQ